MAQKKKQSFMVGAAILTVSTLLVKVLGLLFSIPLANFISTEAMSYFYVAYDIFGIFVMLSTAGLPVAVSRTVGTAIAQDRRQEADRAFSVAFWLFTGVGLAGFLAMSLGSGWIADFYGSPESRYAILALSPTLLFIAMTSAFRGYFQGRSNMVPTALSQTIEAISKMIIGVGLAYYLVTSIPGGDGQAAVGAIVGVSASAGLGLLYLVYCKVRQKRRDREEPGDGDEGPVSGRKEMLISLVRFAVPITIGSCFLSFLDFVDGTVLMHRLLDPAGLSQAAADGLRGILGHARKYFDLPGSFVVPISTSLLPVLSGAIANNDRKSIDHISSVSLRVTLLISIPASVGMFLFSEPICALLLFNRPDDAAATAPLLAVLSLAIAFSSMLFTTNTILQSFGRTTVPIRNMAIGGLVKILLSYVLIGIPEVNVMGSAVSTVVSYLVIVTLNLLSVRRNLPRLKEVLASAAPMLLSALVMGAVSYGAYRGMIFFISPKLALVPAVVMAVAVYAACAVVFRVVTYDEVVLLPKGEALARLLHLKKAETAEEDALKKP